MLKYQDISPNCVEILNQTNNFSGHKKDLKSAAAMFRAQGNSINRIDALNSCILPKESFPLFRNSMQNNHCSLKSYNVEDNSMRQHYYLNTSKPDKLSMNQNIKQQQLNQGKGIYPNNGCIHNIDNTSRTFINEMGRVLDFENEKILYPLREELKALIAECARLDREIANNRNQYNTLVNQIADQNRLCDGYTSYIKNYVPPPAPPAPVSQVQVPQVQSAGSGQRRNSSQNYGCSCYGAKDSADCCSCEDVISAYTSRGWGYDSSKFAQCSN